MPITINDCKCGNPPLVTAQTLDDEEEFIFSCILPDCDDQPVTGPSFTRARLAWNEANPSNPMGMDDKPPKRIYEDIEGHPV